MHNCGASMLQLSCREHRNLMGNSGTPGSYRKEASFEDLNRMIYDI